MVEVFGVLLGAGMVGYAGCGIKSTLSEMYRKRIEDVETDEYQLKLGWQYFGGYHKPIIADMRMTPHMLVCGLSQNGKSKAVEYAMRGKNCVLLNTFKKDFTSINAPTYRELEEMEEYLLTVYNNKKNEEPLFIVIDEILALIKSGNGKKVSDAITKILAVGAHKSIYIIGITQCAEKDVISYKHLFNTRVCFKMGDDSAYRVVLGTTPENIYLQKREFYYVTDNLGKGYTYDI